MYHDVGGIVSLYIDEVQWHTFLDHISISLYLDSYACSPLSDYINMFCLLNLYCVFLYF